jgi:hypothetical protein
MRGDSVEAIFFTWGIAIPNLECSQIVILPGKSGQWSQADKGYPESHLEENSYYSKQSVLAGSAAMDMEDTTQQAPIAEANN